MKEKFHVEEHKARSRGVRIVVVGVGGGGGNMVTELVESGRAEGVTTVVMNTDVQALERCKADIVMQIGEKTTKGLG